MKNRNLNLLIILSLIISSALFMGCRTLQDKDFRPSKRQLSTQLPTLEPLIDTYSFDKAYNRIFANQGSYSGMQQMYTSYWMKDASSIFVTDVKQNISQNLIDNNGYIVCRVINNKPQSKEFWLWIGSFTVFTPWILGAPIIRYKDEVWIEVDVRNIKNELISTYSGHGKYIVSNGLYYGFSLDGSYFRKPIIESMKRALDEVKQKMSLDCNSLTLALNKSMTEIQQERIQSAKQSKIEPANFLEANKNFNEKNYATSIELYNSVLSLYPYHTNALLNRARANSALSDNVAAIKDLTRIIELDPKNVDAFYYRGFAYGNLLELNTAIYNYNKTIELSPNMAQAYLMRGAAEEDLTLYNYAILDYQKVLSLNPNLVFAKERINIIQNRLNQNFAQQQKEAEQDRINRLNALNASLNNLGTSLNNMSNLNKKTNTTNNVYNVNTTKSSSSPELKKKSCTNCEGTGRIDDYVATFGNTAEKWCKECNKWMPANHCHGCKVCPVCKGKGFTESY